VGIRDFDIDAWLEYRAPSWVRWLLARLSDLIERLQNRGVRR